ncbi:MAG: hypothetical protein HQL69_19520, partial [Magnetococcales bacterium]|nr:hypothetical protein [Magnetococcales bacterium]
MNRASDLHIKAPNPKGVGWANIFFLLLAFLLLAPLPHLYAAGGATTDPDKVMGVDRCSKDCHKGEAEI